MQKIKKTIPHYLTTVQFKQIIFCLAHLEVGNYPELRSLTPVAALHQSHCSPQLPRNKSTFGLAVLRGTGGSEDASQDLGVQVAHRQIYELIHARRRLIFNPRFV